MTERELRFWLAYHGHKLLPMRRLELLLAQIALVTVQAATSGETKFTLADFLLEKRKPPPPPTAADGVAAIQAITGARVFRLGQKRK